MVSREDLLDDIEYRDLLEVCGGVTLEVGEKGSPGLSILPSLVPVDITMQETKEEVSKYGKLLEVVIPRPAAAQPSDSDPSGVGLVRPPPSTPTFLPP